MDNKEPNIEQLRYMLKEECELRNSDIIQRLYDAVSVNYSRSEKVEDFVQSIIVSRFKHIPYTSNSDTLTVDKYRQLLYKNRELLKNDAFFMKYNIMIDCPLPLGKINSNIIDNITLLTVDNLKSCKLSSILEMNKKTIILASSST